MGAVQKVGQFLGIDKFGKGLASAGRVLTGGVSQDIATQQGVNAQLDKVLYAMRQETDPEKKKRLLAIAQKVGAGTTTASEIDPGLNLTNKEVLGSAANVALNVLTPGAFKGGKLAVVGKNAVLGGGFGLASGLEKNRDASGIAGSTVGGALLGTGIGVAGIAAKAAKEFLTHATPEWLMNNAVKSSLNDLRKNVKFGGDTLGKQLLDEGVKGGPTKLLEIADTKLSELEGQLQEAISNPALSEARITRKQIGTYLEELVKTKAGIPGMSGDVERIRGILKDFPREVTLQEANTMKRRIYNELRDVAYKLDPKLNAKAGTLKLIAKGLKTEIENAVGGTVVKDLNQKLSIYGRLENSVVDQLARSMRNNKVSLTDAIITAGGAATGNPLAFLASLGISGLRHIGQGLETHAAQGLKKVGEIAEGPVVQGAKDLLKKGTLNLP